MNEPVWIKLSIKTIFKNAVMPRVANSSLNFSELFTLFVFIFDKYSEIGIPSSNVSIKILIV